METCWTENMQHTDDGDGDEWYIRKILQSIFFHLFPFAGKTVGNVCKRVYCRSYAARFTFFFVLLFAVALSRVDDANVCASMPLNVLLTSD